jgi:hypothetical protein
MNERRCCRMDGRFRLNPRAGTRAGKFSDRADDAFRDAKEHGTGGLVLVVFFVAVAGKDRELRILGKLGIGKREIAENEDGASRGFDLSGMKTIGTEASARGVCRLLLRIRHENKDSAVAGRGDC